MTCKILALDGGANWSLLQCMALEALFPGMPGRQILQRFDFVAANSGGSLVLADMLKDLTPSEMLATFDHPNSPSSLFVKLPLFARLPSLAGFGPKFSTAGKRERIQASLKVLGDRTMSDLDELFLPAGKPPKIVIVAFDYDRLRGVFFRSFNSKAGEPASDISLLDAVNSSSTAPVVFFDKPAVVGERRYWDGAIAGYNNPLLVALVEALNDGHVASNIAALSLGTGATCQVPFDHPIKAGPPGFFLRRDRVCLLKDIAKLAGSILDEPPDAATYTAYVAMGNSVVPKPQPGTLVRLNPSVQPILNQNRSAWIAPPGLTDAELTTLMNLPAALTTDEDVASVKALGRKWIEGLVPNEPIERGRDLECMIGDETFAVARKRWRTFDDDTPARS